MTETQAGWFSVKHPTFFTVLPLKTVSAQTEHVFTRDQGWDGGPPMQTGPACITKTHSAQPHVSLQTLGECFSPESSKKDDDDEEEETSTSLRLPFPDKPC